MLIDFISFQEDFVGFSEQEIRRSKKKYSEGLQNNEREEKIKTDPSHLSLHNFDPVTRKQEVQRFVDSLIKGGVAKHGEPNKSQTSKIQSGRVGKARLLEYRKQMTKSRSKDLSNKVNLSTGPSSRMHGFAMEIPKLGLLEMPLLLEGKRQRKLSAKMILKLKETARIDERQQTAEEKATMKVKDERAIVQRARLNLSKAALSKSRKALVRSIRKQHQMKTVDQKSEKKQSNSFSFIPLKPMKLGDFGQNTLSKCCFEFISGSFFYTAKKLISI